MTVACALRRFAGYAFDRTFHYGKLHAAYRAVRAGAVIVATNPDPYCPTPDGGLPDCAAMLAALEACTGRTAEAVVGKPSAYMARTILARLGVLTGATGTDELAALTDLSPIRPDHVIDRLTDLVGTVQESP